MAFAIRAQHDGENLWLVEGGDMVVGTADILAVPDNAFVTDDATLAERIAVDASAHHERSFITVTTGAPATPVAPRTTFGA